MLRLSDEAWALVAQRKAFAVKAVLLSAALFLMLHLFISVTVVKYRIGLDLQASFCLPWRVYLVELDPDPRPYQRGDLVVFHAPPEMGERFEGKVIVKQVAGVAGDRVHVQHDVPWLNGQRLRALDLLGRLNRSSGAFDRVEKVRAGELFVIGTEPRANDSRYWGNLKEEHVFARATPIF